VPFTNPVLNEDEFEENIELIYHKMNGILPKNISLNSLKYDFAETYLDIISDKQTLSLEDLKSKSKEVHKFHNKILENYYLLIKRILDSKKPLVNVKLQTLSELFRL
jgi:hypothetical protein